jgi:acetyltransferase
VVATDEATEGGLELAGWAPETRDALQQLVPDWQPVGNPADLWVALDVVDARRAHEDAFEAVLADPRTDAALGIILAVPAADFAEVRQAFGGLRRRHPDKPLFLVMYGGPVREHWLHELDGLGIPVFASSRLAIRCLVAMQRYAAARERQFEAPVTVAPLIVQ